METIAHLAIVFLWVVHLIHWLIHLIPHQATKIPIYPSKFSNTRLVFTFESVSPTLTLSYSDCTLSCPLIVLNSTSVQLCPLLGAEETSR